MHPKFSFCSWNVRQYKGSLQRLAEADSLITGLDPDIFGLIEFRAKKQVRELMFDRFPEYNFAVTDSKNGLEITVGYKRNKFKQVIWTQRRDFKATPGLRPGGLISVNVEGEYYNLLYLHTDSGSDKKAYANRKAMFKKIWKLRESLQAANPANRANLIVLGDLNTMGNGASVTGGREIRKLAKDAAANRMRMLRKDAEYTWREWGKGPRSKRRKLKVGELAGAMRSDLDHVLASNELDFAAQDSQDNEIHVEGWQQLDGLNLVNYLWSLSDHSALYGEVW
jgi:hypothetical protein